MASDKCGRGVLFTVGSISTDSWLRLQYAGGDKYVDDARFRYGHPSHRDNRLSVCRQHPVQGSLVRFIIIILVHITWIYSGAPTTSEV